MQVLLETRRIILVFKVASTQLQLVVALLPYGNEAQCCQIFIFLIRGQKLDLFVKSPIFKY